MYMQLTLLLEQVHVSKHIYFFAMHAKFYHELFENVGLRLGSEVVIHPHYSQ